MSDATVLLERVNGGDEAAFSELVSVLYDELRERARLVLAGGAAGATIQPTVLVHEAFVKMLGSRTAPWQTRRHFFNAAAQVMRQILVDASRARSARKRGGNYRRVDLDPGIAQIDSPHEVDWEALDAALAELKALDLNRHQVVMLRYFAGLSEIEVARALDISERSVQRQWQAAKLFLRARVEEYSKRESGGS